jgi:hypothetical protein
MNVDIFDLWRALSPRRLAESSPAPSGEHRPARICPKKTDVRDFLSK